MTTSCPGWGASRWPRVRRWRASCRARTARRAAASRSSSPAIARICRATTCGASIGRCGRAAIASICVSTRRRASCAPWSRSTPAAQWPTAV